MSHLRGYGPHVRAGLAELAAVGARAGVRVHASHLWGAPADIQAALTAADEAGVAVTYDMYLYRKSSTILAQLLLPPEVQAGGPDRTLSVLTDPGQRAALLDGEKLTESYLRNVYLGTVPGDRAGAAGLSVAEAAARDSRPPGEWVLDLLATADLNVGGHLDRPGVTDDQLAWISSHDRHCAGSDGIYRGQHPHPRGYGAFARPPGTTSPRVPRPGTSNWPGTWPPARRTFTACATGAGSPGGWPPTCASSVKAGRPSTPPMTARASWRPELTTSS